MTAIVRTIAARMMTTVRSGAIDWCASGRCFMSLWYAGLRAAVNGPDDGRPPAAAHRVGAMRVTMLLADAAQEVNGKLYVLGGGWSVTGPDLPPMAIAIKLDVPWVEADSQHTFILELVDQDGRAVGAGDSGGVRAEGTFEVGRPVGLPAGSDIDFAFAVSIPPFPISPGRFTWKLSIDGESHEDWVRPFQVRAAV